MYTADQMARDVDAMMTADLTERKAWTVATVREYMPDVYVKVGNRVLLGRLRGRKNDFPSVYWGSELTGNLGGAEFAWATIVSSLNNGRPLLA